MLDQKAQELSNKLGEAQAEMQELQGKLDLKNLDFDKLKENSTKLELKNQGLTEQKEAFKQKNDELVKNMVEVKNALTESKALAQKNEMDYVMNNKRFELQCENVKASELQFAKECKDLKAEILNLREKETEWREKAMHLSRENLENEEKIVGLEKEKENIEGNLNEIQDKFERNEKKIAEFTRNEEGNKKKEKSNEELIYKLSSQNDQEKMTKDSLEKKLEGLKETSEDDFLRISEENQKRIDTLELKYRTEIEKKDEEILKIQSEMYSLKVGAERYAKENALLKANLKELLTLKEDSQRILLEKNRVIKELRGKMNALDDDMNRRVLSMTFEKNSLESTIETFKDQVDGTSEKIKSLNSTINSMNSEKVLLRTHVENLVRDKQELVGKFENIRKKLQEKYEDLWDENMLGE